MSAPVDLVHLINHLGRGGTERQLFLLLTHLDRQRFRSRVVVFNPSANAVWDQALAEAGVQVVPVPPAVRGPARRLAWIATRLRRWKPQVVHSWTVHDNPYAGLGGALARVPVRWGSLRGSLHSEAMEALPAMLRRLCLTSVQRLVVNSRALEPELHAAGVAPAKILHLPNAVQAEVLAAAEPADLSELGIPPEAPLVVSVGNLRRIKNHEAFIDALAVALEGRPEARGAIVGQPLASEPEYRARLEKRLRSRGLEGRLVLTGFRDDIPAILRRAQVLCLTSHSEGLPNTVLEAMAAGTPVAAFRVGGVPELVDDGLHGHLVDPGDSEALGRAVARLLEDPTASRHLGARGRDRARERHGCDACARHLEQLYRSALER